MITLNNQAYNISMWLSSFHLPIITKYCLNINFLEQVIKDSNYNQPRFSLPHRPKIGQSLINQAVTSWQHDIQNLWFEQILNLNLVPLFSLRRILLWSMKFICNNPRYILYWYESSVLIISCLLCWFPIWLSYGM